jgi:hypothetical protein
MLISIHSLTGPRALTAAEGERIHALVLPELLAGGCVELDFAGLEVLAAPFLTALLAPLPHEVPPAELNRRLTMSHVPAHAWPTLRAVLEQAKKALTEDDTHAHPC